MSAWYELAVVVPRGLGERAAAALFAAGSAGVQEDFLPGQAPPPRQPWDTGPRPPLPARVLVRGWFEDPDRERVDAQVKADLGSAAKLSWAPVDDVDWETAWRRHFPVIHVGRITVAPPWEDVEGAVIVEPGQGFGTGQHPTTLAMLRAIDELAGDCVTALDVGCGSGILALAAARLGLRARGIDNDPVAVQDALGNAARNGLVVDFDTTPLARVDAPSDLVLANLFAEVLVDLAPELERVTGRYLAVAGILAEREAKVRAALDARLTLVHREVDGEWVALRYRR